jgi:hypothetical protein
VRHSATIAIGAAAALAVAAPAASAAAPTVRQLVVFRDGSALQSTVEAAGARVRVGGRRCGVGTGTPLAALVASDAPDLRVRDYGACTRRAADGGGLYVYNIGPDRARGRSGWVYKVGNREATAGAADPAGPFGRGRLRSGAKVTWFYCTPPRLGGPCQRTLGLRASVDGGAVTVTVRAYDPTGRARPAAAATVHAGDVTATTDSAGRATLTLPPGEHELYAERSGNARSFAERVVVG